MSATLFLFLWISGHAGAAAPPAAKASARKEPVMKEMVRPPAAAVVHTNWRRDPFRPIVPPKPAGPPVLPNGRGGLEVDHLRVVAVAMGGPKGPVAMVANAAGHTYFLRPGDQIFDAEVIRMENDGIWFERTKGQKGASALVYRKVS